MTSSEISGRAILPDALDDQRLVLIKACVSLRLTQEIRLAAFAAQQKRLEFVLAVPTLCVFTDDLRAFIERHAVTVYWTDEA